MARLVGADAAQLLGELIAYPEDGAVKALFLEALLELPRISGVQVAPESHGVMRALGVYRGDAWCYSIAPTKSWLKVWLRPPELSSRLHIAEQFRSAFVDTDDPKSGALTTKLVDRDGLLRLLYLIGKNRNP